MDISEAKLRNELARRDEASLEDRARRRQQLADIVIDKPLPQMVWDYLAELDELYISGCYVSAITLSAAIAEMVLADRVTGKVPMTSNEMEQSGLRGLIGMAHALGILNDTEKGQLNSLRRLRSLLVHGNAGKLDKMVKKVGLAPTDGEDNGAALYLGSIGQDAISQDAFQCLSLVKQLTEGFYGAKKK
jgi:hypothetical protein